MTNGISADFPSDFIIALFDLLSSYLQHSERLVWGAGSAVRTVTLLFCSSTAAPVSASTSTNPRAVSRGDALFLPPVHPPLAFLSLTNGQPVVIARTTALL